MTTRHGTGHIVRGFCGLALAGALSLLTGCLTSDAHLTIAEDGSGELRAEVTPPVELSDALEATQIEALASNALEGVEGASFETQERRGRITYIVEVPFDDYRDLTTNIAGGATVAGQRFTPFSQFDLRELPDGGWSLHAVTNPLAQVVSSSDGSPLAGIVGLAAGEQAGSGLELSVTLPGRLTNSNADSREDNTARWDLNDPSAAHVLQMRTEATPLLSPLQWVLVGLVGLFVVGAVLMFVGARGPVKRKTLFKPSSREREAVIAGSAVESPKQPRRRRRHARRRKRLASCGRTGWENPGEVAPAEPGAPPIGAGPTAGGAQPPRYLPPLGAETHPQAPDEATVEP